MCSRGGIEADPGPMEASTFVTCSRCGTDNPPAARFCMTCGAPLGEPAGSGGSPIGDAATGLVEPAPANGAEPTAGAEPATRASTLPPQFRSLREQGLEREPLDPEWKMSPAGPLPEPPKRRIWLWVLVAIGVVLVLCIVVNVVTNVVVGPLAQTPAAGQ